MQNINRFKKMLKNYPLVCIISDDITAIFAFSEFSNGIWKQDFLWSQDNWEIYCEANDLFWKDKYVFEFLKNHGDAKTGITRESFPEFKSEELAVKPLEPQKASLTAEFFKKRKQGTLFKQ